MKKRLTCVLFGHIFRRYISNDESAPCDYCRKCGLTKEEVGITLTP